MSIANRIRRALRRWRHRPTYFQRDLAAASGWGTGIRQDLVDALYGRPRPKGSN